MTMGEGLGAISTQVAGIPLQTGQERVERLEWT
jgi:hypothetical protein